MDLLQTLQERYIEEFTNNVPLGEFLFNIFTVAVLVSLLRLYYIRFGTAVSNRRKFANNFLPLALGTLLIIMIVKSSIALSLGLVGALSIVRYRAAIKDPEELTFLFLTIGLGLAGGANQPILAIVAFALIMALLFLHKMLAGKGLAKQEGRLFINITTEQEDLEGIAAILARHLAYVELKRLDTLNPGLDLSFLCRADSLEALDRLRGELMQLSPGTKLSVVDQPELFA
jgi:hypothetical protein